MSVMILVMICFHQNVLNGSIKAENGNLIEALLPHLSFIAGNKLLASHKHASSFLLTDCLPVECLE